MADDPSDVLYALAQNLKTAGKGVRAQFLKELRAEAKPLLPAVRRSAANRFPKRGGLNRWMARGTRYRTVARTGMDSAGVSIRANKSDPRLDTQGRVTHPIPDGSGDYLRHPEGTARAGQVIRVVQFYPDAVGYFRDPIEARAELIRDNIVQRLERWLLEHLPPEG